MSTSHSTSKVLEPKIIVTHLQDLLAYLEKEPDDGEEVLLKLKQTNRLCSDGQLLLDMTTVDLKNRLSVLASPNSRKLMPQEKILLNAIVKRLLP